MSLHSLIEPAGTLQTGWKLTDKDPHKADIRNKEGSEPLTVPELEPKARSKWELGEVG